MARGPRWPLIWITQADDLGEQVRLSASSASSAPPDLRRGTLEAVVPFSPRQKRGKAVNASRGPLLTPTGVPVGKPTPVRSRAGRQ